MFKAIFTNIDSRDNCRHCRSNKLGFRTVPKKKPEYVSVKFETLKERKHINVKFVIGLVCNNEFYHSKRKGSFSNAFFDNQKVYFLHALIEHI